MNKEFEKICKMSQASLKNHVRQKLQKTHGTVLNRAWTGHSKWNYGNVYDFDFAGSNLYSWTN